VSWRTTDEVDGFLEVAGEFLRSRPVEHTALLTETAYLQARSSQAVDQRYGWWRDGSGEVAGAFVQAPAHPPILSLVPPEAIDSLPEVLAGSDRLGVDGRYVDAVVASWAAAGTALAPLGRITLWRLGERRQTATAPGSARTAEEADRALLLAWYERLMAANPGDPSEQAYVVDDPLSFGGITIWEVDGEPVAMAGRSRVVAGMTRLGAVFEAVPGEGYGDAAIAAACASAAPLAEHVLVFVAASDTVGAETVRRLGFEPVLDRVMLGPVVDGRAGHRVADSQ